jgi:hypothetical protein
MLFSGNTSPMNDVDVLDTALSKEFGDIFIKVNRWGSFEEADLLANEVTICLLPAPAFVKEYEAKLNREQGLSPIVRH